MKLYKYILAISILFTACEKDNIGPLLDEDNIVFFNEDAISVGEQVTDNIIITVSAIHKNPLSTQITLSGTAVEGIDYTIVNDLNLDFPEGIYHDNIIISLIDNTNFDDDHTIILSLPSGMGYSENNRRELTINIVNDEQSSGTVIRSIDSEEDDTEEGINGSAPGFIDIASSDLEFGEIEGSDTGVQLVGLRFNRIEIPNGATITSASIQFTVDEVVDNPAEVIMTIAGEAVDNATIFSANDFDVSNRTLTTASVDWNIPVWPTKDEAGPSQKTEDIKSVIQEIINRAGWQYDNSLNIIFTPTTATLENPKESGRVAEAGPGSDAATLTIEWEL